MKRLITVAVAIVLVAAVSIGVWANQSKVPTTSDMDKVLANMSGVGASFLKSTNKPTESAGATYDAAFDDDDSTSWNASENTGSYIQKDFDKLTTVNAVIVKEGNSAKNVRKFHIEAWNGKDWVKVYSNDLIEDYHQCIFDETIMTYSIRFVIDKMKDTNVNANISTLSATYQAPIALDNEFINMAYMTDCSYFHNWDPIEPEKMDSYTDVVLIGNWVFDSEGKFQIKLPIVGPGGFDHATDADSEEGLEFTDTILKTYKSYLGEKTPNMWMSLTCLGDTKNADGTPALGAPGGRTSIFLDDTIREKFINDVVDYCLKNGFYGVDVDWEYPSTTEEWSAYGKLVEDFAVALHENNLYMSTAQSLGTGLSSAQLNLFDRINIMSYDNTGAVDGQHSTYSTSCTYTLKYFVNDMGVERSKLVLGLPYYADKLYDCTIQTDWKTIFGYLEMLADANDTEIDTGLNSIKTWSFNGPELLKDKVVYALQSKIGGVFVWQIKNDRPYDDDYSLAKTVSNTIDRFSFTENK